MRVYFIKAPYVSSGLKRSYNKQLEVYSGVRESGKDVVYSDTVYKYHKGKNAWVEKPCTGKHYVRIHDEKRQVVSNMPSLNIMQQQSIVFVSLELAKASKLLLIQYMAKQYEDELVRLKELFTKNVPDVEPMLVEFKEDYPEYFI